MLSNLKRAPARFFYLFTQDFNQFMPFQCFIESLNIGKRDTRWMAVGELCEPEPDSSNKSRAAGFFAAGEKEGKRDTLYV